MKHIINSAIRSNLLSACRIEFELCLQCDAEQPESNNDSSSDDQTSDDFALESVHDVNFMVILDHPVD